MGTAAAEAAPVATAAGAAQGRREVPRKKILRLVHFDVFPCLGKLIRIFNSFHNFRFTSHQRKKTIEDPVNFGKQKFGQLKSAHVDVEISHELAVLRIK